MNCPVCKADTKVSDVRYSKVKESLRRSRKCQCGFKFKTYEVEDGRMAELLDYERAFKKMQAVIGEYE